jgi:hypothetical protein
MMPGTDPQKRWEGQWRRVELPIVAQGYSAVPYALAGEDDATHDYNSRGKVRLRV